MILWVDVETRCDLNLKVVGLHRYAERAEITLTAWAPGMGPVRVEQGVPRPDSEFAWHWANAEAIYAHNSEFDRTMLATEGYSAPLSRWRCTQAQARRHGLPGGLDKLCEIFKVPEEFSKLKAGHAVMLLFCKPSKDSAWPTKHTHPAQWATHLEYAGRDILAMRWLHLQMPTWNDAPEQLVWELDQRVNRRGFAVDVDLATKAVAQLAKLKGELATDTSWATGGQVTAATQRDKLLAYLLAEHGVDLPDLTAATVARRLEDEDLPDAVRELLALRQASSKTSNGKYTALLNTASGDGRLRGAMVYCGAARTKRWAGKMFHPLNLPRPTMPHEDIAEGVAAIKAGVVDLVCDRNLPEVASNGLRGCIVAAPGKRLLAADFANIEGRVVAWLAGEEWKLEAFRAYDAGTGPDLYKLAYAKAFDTTVDRVNEGPQRQIGKVMELMLGFGGGVGAFITGAATYKIDLDQMAQLAWPSIPESVRLDARQWWIKSVEQKKTYGLDEFTFCACDGLKRLWRAAHPRIEALWDDVESAVRDCLATGRTTTAGRCIFEKCGTWLRVQLPSGSYLSYPGARLQDGVITYLGQNQYTRQWSRLSTYGGKLTENITQAVARELLVEGMLNAQALGYHIVLHVYDEAVAEDAPDMPLAGFIEAMTMPTGWGVGLPVVAKGFETDRYHKE